MFNYYYEPLDYTASLQCNVILTHMLNKIRQRISIKKITTHSWFSNNLQSKQTEPTLELDNPNFSHQSVKEIRNIVIEARNQLAPWSTTIMWPTYRSKIKHHYTEFERSGGKMKKMSSLFYAKTVKESLGKLGEKILSQFRNQWSSFPVFIYYCWTWLLLSVQ